MFALQNLPKTLKGIIITIMGQKISAELYKTL